MKKNDHKVTQEMQLIFPQRSASEWIERLRRKIKASLEVSIHNMKEKKRLFTLYGT